MNVYDFKVKAQDGREVSMSDYKGKVLLIVNTATGCGFTPQYDELQDIYDEFKDKGFEILDFPCNQFGEQAPGDDEEIHSFCTGRYGITFPQFSKVDVNGEKALPLFDFLKQEKGFAGFNPEHPLAAIVESMLERSNPNYKNEPDIKWNFTKFLVDRAGNIVARFEPTDEIEVIEKVVKELL